MAWIFLLLNQVGILSVAGSENPQKWLKLIGIYFSHVTKNPEVCGCWHGSVAQRCRVWHFCSFFGLFFKHCHYMCCCSSRHHIHIQGREKGQDVFFSCYINFHKELSGPMDRILLVARNVGAPLKSNFWFCFLNFCRKCRSFTDWEQFLCQFRSQIWNFLITQNLGRNRHASSSSFNNSGQNFFYSTFPLRGASQFQFPTFHMGIKTQEPI